MKRLRLTKVQIAFALRQDADGAKVEIHERPLRRFSMTIHLPLHLVATGLVLAAVASSTQAETDAPIRNIAGIADTQTADESGPNRFVIVSDLHPNPTAYEQVDLLVKQVIAVRPAFAIVLGDIGGDEPETSSREMEKLRTAFRRLRDAGIEVYPIMGNHDVHPRVEDLKVEWFLGQEPLPLNPLFDADRRSPAYETFEHRGPYNYSFNRGGIHFVVVDSNTIPPKGNLEPAGEAARKARWEIQERWLRDDLCKHVNNPQRLPTLVFLHHPEYMTGDRGFVRRPLFHILESCRDAQTVKAVFGGHWHYGQSFPAARNLGAEVYAVPVSVHPESQPLEFIVANVHDDQIVLTPRDVLNGQPRTDPKPLHYHPIPGRFSNLRNNRPARAK